MKGIYSLFFAVFFIGGLVMCIIGMHMQGSEERFRQEVGEDALTVSATIVDIDREYSSSNNSTTYVYVEYIVNDELYTNTLSFYSSGMSIGDKVEILVNSKNPYSFVTIGAENAFATILLLSMGGLFALIGLAFGFALFRNIRQDSVVKRDGVTCTARVVAMDVNHNVRVNGRPIPVIVAEYNGITFRANAPMDTTTDVGDTITIQYLQEEPNKFIIL